MHKVMIFLKRRQDLSFADFKSWAENQHTRIAAKLPGIRGYRMNVPPAETAALLKAFMKIQDATAREMIVKLVERLSATKSTGS